MRASVRFLAVSFAVATAAVACGSRTGLVSDLTIYAEAGLADGPSNDGTISDETGPIFEGGPLDAVSDCPFPAVCDPADPGYVYQCGQRVYQCSSLQQCEETCQGEECGAQCVNPCMDTLGQNTSNGCDFYPVEMDTGNEVAGSCFAVFVINQWKTGQPARIEVDLGGTTLPIEQFARIPVGQGLAISYQPYDATVGLQQDQVAVLFLSRDPAAANDTSNGGTDPRALASCPPGIVPAVVGDAALHGTGIGTAFHIQTNVPVVAYQMLPYGGGSARVTGATLLLPTNVWDTNYVAANAYAEWEVTGDRGEPTLAIIAQQDATHVTLAPTVNLFPGDGGVPAGSPAGVPVTYTLNQGQYLQISQDQEITGTPIVSDAPVAVIGGSTLYDVPVTETQRADCAEQMLPPVRALGSEYVAVRYRSRPINGAGYDSGTFFDNSRDAGVVTLPDGGTDEVVPWRVVGAVDGTLLTYDPVAPAGAPTILNAKQLVEFYATGPFVVRSQDSAHPFYFASYMTGGFPFDGDGDPEYVNVVPPAQYLPRYTFFTDPTYPETNLVIVRARDGRTGAMPDVTMDCAGLLGGWAPVDLADRFEFTRLDLSTGDFVGQNGCDNGVHTIAGTFPGDAGSATPAFGVTVWGWGNDVTLAVDDETNPLSTRWVSYGYPAGANFAKLNDVVVPAQ